MSGINAEAIQNQLKKNGFNLSQLNIILSQGIHSSGSNDAGLKHNYHGGSSSSGGYNQGKKAMGSGGSRGRTGTGGGARGIFDLTPDSGSNGGTHGHKRTGGIAKSSKSNNSGGYGSYSPQSRGENRVSSAHNTFNKKNMAAGAKRDGSSKSGGNSRHKNSSIEQVVGKSKKNHYSFNQPP